MQRNDQVRTVEKTLESVPMEKEKKKKKKKKTHRQRTPKRPARKHGELAALYGEGASNTSLLVRVSCAWWWCDWLDAVECVCVCVCVDESFILGWKFGSLLKKVERLLFLLPSVVKKKSTQAGMNTVHINQDTRATKHCDCHWPAIRSWRDVPSYLTLLSRTSPRCCTYLTVYHGWACLLWH